MKRKSKVGMARGQVLRAWNKACVYSDRIKLLLFFDQSKPLKAQKLQT